MMISESRADLIIGQDGMLVVNVRGIVSIRVLGRCYASTGNAGQGR